jgi:alanyl-tRNA synthetase
VAAGVRRIEAVTGKEAEAIHRASDTLIDTLSGLLKTSPDKALGRLEKLLEENKALADSLKSLKQKELSLLAHSLKGKEEVFNGVPVIFAETGVDPADLKTLGDEIMDKKAPLGLVLVNKGGDKCALVIRLTDDLVTQGLDAGKMVKELAPLIKGSGGGKPNMAQAGGTDASGTTALFEAARAWLKRHGG